MINCSSLKNKISKDGKLKENSLSKDPKALKFYNKGLDETSKKDYKKAIENYKKAVKIDSNFTFAWDNMGICYRRLENYDKAIESYKKSLEIDPYGMMPLQNIAVAYAYDKQYEEAINAYKKLSELDSNNPEVYYGIGQIYYEYIKDYEKSLSYVSKAYNLYIAQKSPYRSDAEKIISYIYTIMKKEGKLAVFKKILQDNNIKLGK